MSFQNQASLQSTLQNLKEIVTQMKGEDHEVIHLMNKMETLATKIELSVKGNGIGNKDQRKDVMPAPSF